MEFQVLGALRVIGDDGAQVRLPSRAQRRLVSLLVLHAGRVVAADRLADPLALSGGALRTSVSRVRRLLGDVLVTDGAGYSLRVDRSDVTSFERLFDESASRVAGRERIGDLRAALRLWRGEAYEEFADEAWAAGEAQRLARIRADAHEALAEALLAVGDHGGALSVLDAVMTAEPYRDRPRELAMRALSESGRRVEALRLFQSYCRVLAEEVGTEPSHAIVALERSIAAAGVAPQGPWNRLPATSSSFVGRTREVETVRALVATHRLVTITGAGGIGKSRVALRVVDELVPGRLRGTWFVELARVAGPGGVGEEIARAVGAPSVAVSSIDVVASLLATAGPCLIVLDNAEHVLGAVAAAVASLLRSCPELRIMVTSREPLGVTGERVWRLPPMSTPASGVQHQLADLEDFDSSRLFLDRMRSIQPDASIDDQSAEVIAAICARLGGLPLAVELAAARTRSLPLRWILEGVESALALLDPDAVGSDRQRSLRASVAWSVDLLEPELRTALGRLSVFWSPFIAEAAAAVIAPERSGTVRSLPALVRLCDKSLLQFDPGSGRYQLLEPIREYAWSTLLDDAARHEASAHHARWWARRCLEIGEGQHGIDRSPVLAEMPDVVAAMEWARDNEPERAMQMCVGLGSIRTTLGHHENLVAMWHWLLGPDGPPRTTLWAGAAASLMAPMTGARHAVETAVPVIEAHLGADDQRARGWLARGRAMVPAYRGVLEPIVQYSATVIAREDDVEASVYLGFAAYMLALGGRLPEAARLVRHLDQVTQRHSAPFSVDSVGNGYAAAVLTNGLAGRLTRAVELGDRAVPEDPAFSITAAAALAHVALQAGDRIAVERAISWGRRGTIPLLRYLGAELDLCRAVADGDVAEAAVAARRCIAWATVPLGLVHRCALVTFALLADGQVEEARAVVSDVADAAKGMTDVPWARASVVHAEALLARAEGRTNDLRRQAVEVLALAERFAFATLVVDASELLAEVSDGNGDRDTARRLRTEADAERVRLGYRLRMIPSDDDERSDRAVLPQR